MALSTAVVYGSARRDREGIKAAKFMVAKLDQRGHDVYLVDSQVHEFPILDLMYKEYLEGTAPPAMESVAEIFRSADGFIIVSGEYNHSVPAALKNLLDHYQSEYLYKPSGIVTYSAGPFGGVRGLVNLRGILAELGTLAIPSAFPVLHVQNAFDEHGNALDESYDSFVAKFLDEYEWYAEALKTAREKKLCNTKTPVQQEMARR